MHILSGTPPTTPRRLLGPSRRNGPQRMCGTCIPQHLRPRCSHDNHHTDFYDASIRPLLVCLACLASATGAQPPSMPSKVPYQPPPPATPVQQIRAAPRFKKPSPDAEATNTRQRHLPSRPSRTNSRTTHKTNKHVADDSMIFTTTSRTKAGNALTNMTFNLAMARCITDLPTTMATVAAERSHTTTIALIPHLRPGPGI